MPLALKEGHACNVWYANAVHEGLGAPRCRVGPWHRILRQVPRQPRMCLSLVRAARAKRLHHPPLVMSRIHRLRMEILQRSGSQTELPIRPCL